MNKIILTYVGNSTLLLKLDNTIRTLPYNKIISNITIKPLGSKSMKMKILREEKMTLEEFKEELEKLPFQVWEVKYDHGLNIMMKYPAFIEILLKKDIYINYQDDLGNTILFHLLENKSKYDYLYLFKILMENKFDMSIKNKKNISGFDLIEPYYELKKIFIDKTNNDLLFIEDINEMSRMDSGLGGHPEEKLLIILYFMKTYKNIACAIVPKTFTSELIGLRWSCHDSIDDTHKFRIFWGFADIFNKCLSNDSRFIICPISLSHKNDDDL